MSKKHILVSVQLPKIVSVFIQAVKSRDDVGTIQFGSYPMTAEEFRSGKGGSRTAKRVKNK